MEKNSKKDFETLEEAAQRLLAKLNARKRPAGERPAEIQNSTKAPVEEGAAEVAAVVCANFSGSGGLVPANDNKFWQRDFADVVFFPIEAVATRSRYSGDGTERTRYWPVGYHAPNRELDY